MTLDITDDGTVIDLFNRYTRQKPRKTRRKLALDDSASTTNTHHGPELLSSITANTASDTSNAVTQPCIDAQIEPTYQEDVADKRPSQQGNSLTLSSIIQMARRVKEIDSSQMSTPLTDRINLQSEPELVDAPSLQDALVMPEREDLLLRRL
ncbi:hypothetical protein NW762_008392 [Fusarium torreyae]|uniref:Uncharacterized protein n=1 Tax=Fusarium torreyae TaxID=1237075 RepID=A0A9W8VCG4_9HYPO|nr:hypothetical protein NW762_008392 [Fusarium torreyae]